MSSSNRPALSESGRRVASYVVSITPFDAEGQLDEAGVRAHLRRMAASGIGIYVGGGGSGEGFTLTDAEMGVLLDTAVDELDGRVRAMGIEPRTAEQMIAFTKRAAEAGVEACQIYSLDPGHGHRPTLAEIETYFDAVLGACPVPAVISTHQSVGYKVPVEMLVRLADRHGNVIGINSSHGDSAYLSAIVDALANRLEICVGGPGQAMTALGLGAHGFLCSEANLAPDVVASLVSHAASGDLAATLADFGRLARLSDLLYGNGGIRITKALLRALGLPGGHLRAPQVDPSPEAINRVRSAAVALAGLT